MFRRLLVPLDGSELAERALPHAQALAERFGASILLAEAVPPTAYVVPGDGLGTADAGLVAEAWESARDEAAAYLDRARQKLPSKIGLETEVLEGAPVPGLLEYAERQGVDLIVMTTHGRGGLERLVFGSVAQQLLQQARVPLLLIRAAGGAAS